MSEKFTRFFSLLMSFFMLLFSFLTGENKVNPPTPEENESINIIYMIGDGMGFNHLEAAKQYLGITLFMDTIETRGSLKTYSASSSVTDSAAAGTALACGVKTNNGCIGVYPTDVNAATSYPMSLTEFARSNEMKTGILTTDSPYGATPAAFCAHTSSRNNSADIIAQQMTSGTDLLWFASSGTYWTESDAQAHGYTYVTSRQDALALKPGTATVGEFPQSTMWKGVKSSGYGRNPSLSELTEKAIDLLDNENGFFLMVEGAHIDKNAHNNDMELTVWAVDEFDNAVEKAVEFAKENTNTIVIVTADHETGGLTLTDGEYAFTTGSHTGANVPLLVYGDAELIENGAVLDNIELPDKVAAKISNEKFPVEVRK